MTYDGNDGSNPRTLFVCLESDMYMLEWTKCMLSSGWESGESHFATPRRQPESLSWSISKSAGLIEHIDSVLLVPSADPCTVPFLVSLATNLATAAAILRRRHVLSILPFRIHLPEQINIE